jgi:Icc-related predicted phosphoesterase
MKLIAISDTHNRHKKINIPDGDVIIHAGDATSRGATDEVEKFLDWYASLPHKHKIFVSGNHDWLFERNNVLARQMCSDRGIIYLEDSGVEIEGVKFWGSPIQPWFYSWAFNRRRTLEEATRYNEPWIKNHWDLIPEGTNVLITHGPPHGILDELVYADGTPKGEFVGCEELLKAVKRIKPDVHIFGHIHCGYGILHQDGTSFYNAAICDEVYMASNEPHEIDFTTHEDENKNP